ncbi:TIGR02710 family CRISPR-associated protein, partial [candidate division KSB3 bacterium]|nr:TIGR02710 family CRISPR-associated protein [candidate division KSB3 bacterium]MBD3325850.1 TIGR02710 family CRISPR-associated protein [candidate division KSB3 bacterium]
MKKLMIITLGTGRGVENGVANSIAATNPDKVIFLITQASQAMPEKVKEAFCTLCRKEDMPTYHAQKVQDAEDPEDAYQTTLEAFQLAKQWGYTPENISLDFTSGTKAMSVGASLAGFFSACKSMVYVGGKKRDVTGRVEKGREKVRVITPNEILADYNQRLAKQMFNIYQFDAGLNILRRIQQRIVRNDLSELEIVFQAYERWDKFDHRQALKLFDSHALSRDVRQMVGKNKGFVAQMVNAIGRKTPPDIVPEILVDLLANAARRAEEGKFDDAVARLYRLTELLVQYRLQEGINISSKGLKTSEIDVTLLPEHLQPTYDALRRDGKIKIGLKDAFI